jgi:hypothetical protein
MVHGGPQTGAQSELAEQPYVAQKPTVAEGKRRGANRGSHRGLHEATEWLSWAGD